MNEDICIGNINSITLVFEDKILKTSSSLNLTKGTQINIYNKFDCCKKVEIKMNIDDWEVFERAALSPLQTVSKNFYVPYGNEQLANPTNFLDKEKKPYLDYSFVETNSELYLQKLVKVNMPAKEILSNKLPVAAYMISNNEFIVQIEGIKKIINNTFGYEAEGIKIYNDEYLKRRAAQIPNLFY